MSGLAPEAGQLSLSLARQVDQVCDRFEEDWLAGRQPRIEDYLGKVPEEARRALLRELLRVELEQRRRGGEAPATEDYRTRFPDHIGLISTLLVRLPGCRDSRIYRLDAGGAPVEPHPDAEVPLPAIPGYKVLRVVGRGGMGVVYEARQVALNRPVALKMILAGAGAGERERARFWAEAEAVARLRHPNIVQIYEVGEQDGRPYLSLEFVEGGNLAQQLKAAPRSPRAAAELVEVLARAVHAAHQQGVIHRDLKPGNVLLARDGTVKITDFGLAKRLDGDTGQTTSGTILGTPSYMAPEQAGGKGREVGPAADVYALGAILYEALTGRPPFQGATLLDTLEQVRSQDAVPPTRLQPKTPRDLETICLKCLHKEARRRYASAQALADDLRRFLDGRPILARPVGAGELAVKWARRRPVVAALLAAIVFTAGLAVGEAVISTWQWRAAVKARREAESLTTRLALRQCQALCEQGDIGRGMLLLAHALKIAPSDDLRRALRADLAGWRARLHPLRELLAHPAPVRDAVFSPDSQTVLTVGADNRVRLWDVATGHLRTPPLAHPARVRAASFSPDGQLVLTVAEDGVARLWDATTGALFQDRELRAADGGPVSAAVFSPDGQYVATADDHTLRLWDVVTGQQRPPTADHRGRILALAFSRKGKVLVTAGADGTARRWDVDTLRAADREGPLRLGDGKVRAAFFSPDGRYLLTLSEDPKKPDETPVDLWEVTPGSTRPHVAALPHKYAVRAVAFSPRGDWLCTGGEDHGAQVWDVRNGEAQYRSPLPHQDTVVAAAFSPDGRTLLTGSDDRTARLWNVETGRPIGPPLEHQGSVRAVGLGGPGGRTLLTASADKTARIWDAAAAVPYLREFHEEGGHDAQVMCVAWSPDGRAVLAGLDNGHAQVWQALTDDPLGPPLCHENDVWAVAFDPDGSCFATGGRGRTVHLWDAATGRLLRALRHEHRVRSAAFTPDGRFLLTGTGDGSAGEARLWDVASGTPAGEPLEKGDVVWQVACSPDGRTAAVALGDNKVRLWDLPSRTPRDLPPLQQSRVVALAFSPDGRLLLTGSTDRTARLWDVASGEPVGEPLQHPGAVWSVAFSADGRTLVTGCRDGMARLWDAATGAAVGPPCPHDGVVWAVACHPTERTFLSGSGDGRARIWPIPAPVEGDPARITLWVQLVTAMRLDENGNTHWLNADDWAECRRRLEQLGGPPIPPQGR